MNALNRFAIKFSSGQYYLTVVVGIVFAYASMTGLLPSEAVSSVITMVIVFYFKRDRKPNEETTPTDPDNS